MIVSIGSKKGKIVLRCEECLQDREVQRNTAILEKTKHPCRGCSNKLNGVSKRGKPSWNSGKKMPQEQRKTGNVYLNHHGYLEVWLGEDSLLYGRKDGYVLLHRKNAQDALGRPLLPKEVVHHIDGDKTNNEPHNLFVCNGISQHRDIHNNLEQVAFFLIKSGLIAFDRDSQQYNIAPHVGDNMVELGEFRERLRPAKG